MSDRNIRSKERSKDSEWHNLPACPSCKQQDQVFTFHLGAQEATVTCRRCQVQTYGPKADQVWRSFAAETKPEPDWKHRAEEADRILADNMALANRTTRRAMNERNAIIKKLRERYSAIEIADMVGLTRQRVHQILNEAPVEASPEKAAAPTPMDPARQQHDAEEYECAMMHLDDLGVPREQEGALYSLVGRIEHLRRAQKTGAES